MTSSPPAKKTLLSNRGFLFLTLNTAIAVFSFSFVPFFLQQNGYSLWQIILLYVLYTSLASFCIMIIPFFRLRNFIILGFVLHSLAALLFVWFSPASYFLYVILLALITTFYWVPLNWLFFRHAEQGKHATHSSFYFLAPGIASLLLPPLGAFVIRLWGFHVLFSLTAVLYLIPAVLGFYLLPKEKETTPFWNGLREYKGLKSITFLEGAIHFFGGVILPTYGLLFFKTESDVGIFLSYLGALAVILAVFLSRRSDTLHRRKTLLSYLFIATTITILGFIFVKTKIQWFVVVGFFTLLTGLSSPLRLAISLDEKAATATFWKSREFCLNVGRASTLAIAAFFFFHQQYLPVFVLYGLITLLYPWMVHVKLKNVE
ncbi:hypothetical protein HY496_00190 [Candidatus Woesearchaeota archaeon]|nr:hypothetical protein [Candidatus Woesearchaeota archaeon]